MAFTQWATYTQDLSIHIFIFMIWYVVSSMAWLLYIIYMAMDFSPCILADWSCLCSFRYYGFDSSCLLPYAVVLLIHYAYLWSFTFWICCWAFFWIFCHSHNLCVYWLQNTGETITIMCPSPFPLFFLVWLYIILWWSLHLPTFAIYIPIDAFGLS